MPSRDGNTAAVLNLVRFHAALAEMTGRLGVRNDMSKYEAVGMAMVEARNDVAGALVDRFPPASPPARQQARRSRSPLSQWVAGRLGRISSATVPRLHCRPVEPRIPLGR